MEKKKKKKGNGVPQLGSVVEADGSEETCRNA